MSLFESSTGIEPPIDGTAAKVCDATLGEAGLMPDGIASGGAGHFLDAIGFEIADQVELRT